GQRMLDAAFTPGGKCTTQRKDLDQALQLAAESELELPITALVRDLYDRLIEAGGGDLDHSALVKVIAGD
ncbi:MAG: NAD-binding protein, partial [Gammaproteobacteria bacterium]|nr:NAD-binding protein [Gammaproteobacteria bacterium]